MTNREWLESLSDEEFSKEVLEGAECTMCVKGSYCFEDHPSCLENHIKWLQAEHKAEGDNGDKKE